jgi:hypothetical protein
LIGLQVIPRCGSRGVSTSLRTGANGTQGWQLHHQRTNLLNTEDNEKSFANVSEVAGNSRIKMEGFAKPGERFQRPNPKAVVLPIS